MFELTGLDANKDKKFLVSFINSNNEERSTCNLFPFHFDPFHNGLNTARDFFVFWNANALLEELWWSSAKGKEFIREVIIPSNAICRGYETKYLSLNKHDREGSIMYWGHPIILKPRIPLWEIDTFRLLVENEANFKSCWGKFIYERAKRIDKDIALYLSTKINEG